MRKTTLTLVALVIVALVPLSTAGAATLFGCGGADFGAGCSLQELISGGSIETGGLRFDQWALPGNFNEIGANLSLIQVVPIDETIATGLTYTGNDTLRYEPGATDPIAVDLKLGFRLTGLGGAQVAGDELEILSRTFDTGSLSAFAFLFQSDCTSGFDAPTACASPITGGSPQAISDQMFPPDMLLGTGSFAPQSTFFVTLGIQLGGVEGDAVTLGSFEQRFALAQAPPNGVPEPGSLVLLASTGVGLLAVVLRRRRASQ